MGTMMKSSSDKPLENYIDAEWDRISQNPDNMIVSDVLADILPRRNVDKSAVVRLQSKRDNRPGPTMQILRAEYLDKGWKITCSASVAVGHEILRAGPNVWSGLEILIGEESVREHQVGNRTMCVSVEFPLSHETDCTVALSY